MRCVNLYEDTITKLGIHYSYNKQLENDENFKKYIAKIENVLKLWRARSLSHLRENYSFQITGSIQNNSSGSCENNTTLHNRSVKQNTEEFYLERVKP